MLLPSEIWHFPLTWFGQNRDKCDCDVPYIDFKYM